MDGSTHAGPRLPPELYSWIIDILYISDISDIYYSSYDNRLAALSTLYACALTCRSWRDHAQYLLFHVVHLRSIRALRSLTDVIRASPRLGTYVEKITLLHDDPNSADSATASFPASLKGFLPRLQAVEIHTMSSEETGNSTPLPLHQRFPLWLGSFHTVTTFMLGYTTFASFGTFLRVVNAFPSLTHLQLSTGITWRTVGHLPPFMTTAGAAPEVGNESLSSRRREFLPHLQFLVVAEPWPQEELQTFLASLGASLEVLWLPHPLLRVKVAAANDPNVDGGIVNVEPPPPPTPPPSVSLAHLKSLETFGVYIQSGADSPRQLSSLSGTINSWWTAVDASESQLSVRTFGISPWRQNTVTRSDFLSALVLLGSQLEDMAFASMTSQTQHTLTSVPFKVRVWLQDKRERWDEWDVPVITCFPRMYQLRALQTTFEHPRFPWFQWQDYDSASEALQIPENSQAAGSSKRAEDSVSTATHAIEDPNASPGAHAQTNLPA